ncbi:hypothetical protein A2V49_00485 [candidate division WWE3 bacterium RBG_19FT_COMBO_34_6]|uniref:DUF4012 domain-containing protein n=1 Tax=candidate division WWE3 bacterium RBG_19FT_COMBO_34_6 TaxID=1802612 RepID=A0A1F4UQR8_UNCKA|nr:MAG: hypothetical protein A2V49_00485 [candidate division WWE3 bacterium RBG_19FT_COMBO_34_6]
MDIKEQPPIPVTAEPIFVAKNDESKLINRVNEIPEIPGKKKYKLKISWPKFASIFAVFDMSIISKILLFLVVLFSFLIVFVFYPTLNVYKSAKRGMTELEKVPSFVSQFDSQSASSSADLAYKEFLISKKNLASLSWIYKLVGSKEEYTSISKFLSSVTYFSKVSSDLSKSVEPLKKIWEAIKPNSEATFDQTALDNSKLHMSDAKNNLQLAKADFDQVDVDKLPVFIKDGAFLYKEILDKTEYSLNLAYSITGNLGDLLGAESPKEYLILFQNNNEIRPTGGFIGSYARIYLNKGKIEELLIDDIYNPDGQLDVRNIKVAPPKPIGDLLAEDRLYIRNANWDPDFPRSAQVIQDLFFKLDGKKIDGIIAVDLDLVKNLIKVTGPIFLTAYNEEISDANLYERTQYYASYDYKEGSMQKKEFLTVLGSKLVESLFGMQKEKTPLFLQALQKSLSERHMQIFLFSNQLNAFLQEKKWGGSLIKTESDYLQVVNANLGGTKANYYVDNKMDYKITSKTRDGVLRAELTLDYKHNGVDESWPGGPYTDYLRILAQKGSKLTGAKIIYDNTVEEDIFNKIVISWVDPYVSFETNFILKPSSIIKLVFYYDLPENLSITKDTKKYNLVWQKQAGTDADIFSFSFAPPFGMEFNTLPSNIKLVEEIALTSGNINEDFNVSLELK